LSYWDKCQTLTLKGLRQTACILTAEAGFVMSSVGILTVGQSLRVRS